MKIIQILIIKTPPFTLLKKIIAKKTNLLTYDTENERKELKVLEALEPLSFCTCITQLPNEKLFCFGSNNPVSGVSLIIDGSYGIQQLPSGIPCYASSAIYKEWNVYCFGGWNDNSGYLMLSREI